MSNSIYNELINKLNIKLGDNLFISSDLKRLFRNAIKNKEKADPNILLDMIKQAVGPEGTILIPTYNWDFCKGLPFDYNTTPCKTGTLGIYALKREDFVRTKHPIYSFAVTGKLQKDFYSLNNVDSFSEASPFNLMNQYKFKNIIIDVSMCHSFTFVHYVEECSGVVNYRYIKNFTSDYTDETNRQSKRTYSMFVRKLEINVTNTVDPIIPNLKKANAMTEFDFEGIDIKVIDLAKSFDVIMEDIKYNNSKLICTHD